MPTYSQAIADVITLHGESDTEKSAVLADFSAFDASATDVETLANALDNKLAALDSLVTYAVEQFG